MVVLEAGLDILFSETEYFNEPSGWHPPNFDRTHTLNLVSTFDLTKTLEISSAVTYSSGNPYTPILGKVYDWNQNLNSETCWYPYEKLFSREQEYSTV